VKFIYPILGACLWMRWIRGSWSACFSLHGF